MATSVILSILLMAEASKTDCLSLWKGIDMVYCYLIIMVFILFLTFLGKNVYHPAFIFTGIWVLNVFLTTLQLYELNETFDWAYTVIFFGVLFFFAGLLG